MKARSYLILIVAVFLCACGGGAWTSKQKLIGSNDADDPFGGASYALAIWKDADDEIPIVIKRSSASADTFVMFAPETPEDSQEILFKACGWPWEKSFVLQMQGSNKGYSYLHMERVAHGWVVSEPVEKHSKTITSVEQIHKIVNAADAQNRTKKWEVLVKDMSVVEATAYINMAKAEAQKRKLAEQREKQLAAEREKQLAAEEARRKALADDREPTQYEMNMAVRSIVAGQILQPNITKLGSCRKVAAYDYYCRYDWFGVSWGNFWKEDGRWYFKLVEGM